jgi:AraC-like DNA-binding protein
MGMRAGIEHVSTPPDSSWAYREFRQPGFDFHWHAHEELELTLITAGGGTRVIGTSIESYRPMDLALIGPDVPHAYVSTPGTAHHAAVVIQLRRDFLGKGFFTAPEFIGAGRLIDAASGGLVFDRSAHLAERLAALGNLSASRRTLALVEVLLALADEPARSLSADASLVRLGESARRRAQAVSSHLQTAYAGRVRLADVASVAHMSPAALSRFFRRATGRTMTQYVAELRIAAACQLLSDSDLSIATIAARCGYENLSNFNRRFRALRGMSPRAYRRVMEGEASHPPA